MDGLTTNDLRDIKVPFFGARRLAHQLASRAADSEKRLEAAQEQLARIGGLTLLEVQAKVDEARQEAERVHAQIARDRKEAEVKLQLLLARKRELEAEIVVTEEAALLQQAGVYKYTHPLDDAIAYRLRLDALEDRIKSMVKKDGGAVEASTNWTVNNSVTEGRAMVRDFSKLMLRAFNAEADNLVRTLKPYKLDAAIERLLKVAQTIQRLGSVMNIRIADAYVQLRLDELRLTADFLQKQAEEKERERAEKERLREERKAQQELERERQRLLKERTHYENALAALRAAGDSEAASRMEAEIADCDRAIADVDYREANIRAGYVYVISNIGSFGEEMIKVGMTRRLDPMDRIRELGDASVPFDFDVHALFFSKDAVGIETQMHSRLANARVNRINLRREFFRATPTQAKVHLSELAGDILQFHEVPEALQFRESKRVVDAESEANGAPTP